MPVVTLSPDMPSDGGDYVFCPQGVTVPDNVDQMLICGNPPASTVTLASFQLPSVTGDEDLYGFQSADNNVACTFYQDATVTCHAATLDVPLPSDPKTEGSTVPCTQGLSITDDGAGLQCAGDVMAVEQMPGVSAVPVLDIGQIALSSDYPNTSVTGPGEKDLVACTADEDGIICWDTVSAHGFKMSQSVVEFW